MEGLNQHVFGMYDLLKEGILDCKNRNAMIKDFTADWIKNIHTGYVHFAELS